MWNKFMASRGTLLAAAAFFVILLVCGVLAVIRSLDGDDPEASRPATPAPSAPSASAAALCPSDTATTVPTTRLPDLRWEQLGPLHLPYSASAGPCQVTETTAAGFAHTPAGAIVAAAQITSRTSITTPLTVATETIEQQVIAGPARDQLLAKTRTQKPVTEETAGQLTAWSMLSYSDDTAVISLAMTNAALQGQYVTIPVTLRWADEDWRMVAPPTGSWDSSAAVTPTLQGYVEWGRP
ncbi:hypothetical protein AMIS_12780 [Actinoplanes missouriensis 431]|uniref:DUF8175 domain-containing protein n=1 Tax=Actinoplanes missouriensis (strain ATCC 14538 / DSM 43046 / CBS 188.64 / JCM 3121 / NBRC 102363 / NCIMB 12654 / NRRL B-3342 / UNCC 431) TaxID=512565 RepID=I0H0G1_ACTM4|nr:hypothetical protein [Actinoplanes missouriensis]BAL86498.1 hypothetical protein AMIS_12780 [Actinoplanes missouriensis 431]